MAQRAHKNVSYRIIQFIGLGLALLLVTNALTAGKVAAAVLSVMIWIIAVGIIVLFGYITFQLATRPPKKIAPAEPTQPVQNTFENVIGRLRKIDWFQFEQLVEVIYQKKGWQVERRGGARPDGGIDLIITSQTGERAGIQCKHYRHDQIGAAAMRDFIGALKIAGLEKGIFICLRGYTAEARQAANSQGIQLLNETDLSRLLDSINARVDSAIVKLLNGTKKLCPKCENPLVLRTCAQGWSRGRKFWGCSKYPDCKGTMKC